jgi:hypothetical protein
MAKKLPPDVRHVLKKILKNKNVPTVKPGKMKLGSMLVFLYDAKHKATLPYWDLLPLSVVLAKYPDGFLGISLHYIPWTVRIQLATQLMRSVKNKNRITYVDIKKAFKAAKLPIALAYLCIKRYLYSHIRSEIRSFDWETYHHAVKNISPRFQKKSHAEVVRLTMAEFNKHAKKVGKKPSRAKTKKR